MVLATGNGDLSSQILCGLWSQGGWQEPMAHRVLGWVGAMGEASRAWLPCSPLSSLALGVVLGSGQLSTCLAFDIPCGKQGLGLSLVSPGVKGDMSSLCKALAQAWLRLGKVRCPTHLTPLI